MRHMERRLASRLEVVISGAIVSDAAQRSVVDLYNLSETGAYIGTSADMLTGVQLKLTLTPEAGINALTLTAKTVRKEDRDFRGYHGYGLRFIFMSPAKIARLKEVIREIKDRYPTKELRR